MATMTMSAGPSGLKSSVVRPYVSSPLAANGPSRPTRNTRLNAPAFPTSRPLRPFPSIANVLPGTAARKGISGEKKTIKLIEPPANVKCAFVLNLTQAEFSRQD
ncbi:uncharacterized protein LAESUDRAFT_725535 [Laetiporus sulphureus 93-53]|uniref:Uncharacterized protein n=1 Tax=Laetiporus sulphureus 93-53 TaxID=1314785 RepID=A0A165ED56_9APHY|nr:uncharacterized protein LAESUDRAFT_725535 [Laetiporus sulphureus 93-53]KZT06777.1 hypothetical protein LAESUDRAFT_725535 [Laetiporus sulphureus 93-53]